MDYQYQSINCHRLIDWFSYHRFHRMVTPCTKLLENQSNQGYKRTTTSRRQKNVPFCYNPAELLTWKHPLCEEFRNWLLSFENNMGINRNTVLRLNFRIPGHWNIIHQILLPQSRSPAVDILYLISVYKHHEICRLHRARWCWPCWSLLPQSPVEIIYIHVWSQNTR